MVKIFIFFICDREALKSLILVYFSIYIFLSSHLFLLFNGLYNVKYNIHFYFSKRLHV